MCWTSFLFFATILSPFECTVSTVALSICTLLYSHYNINHQDTFHILKLKFLYPLCNNFLYFFPHPLSNNILFSVFVYLTNRGTSDKWCHTIVHMCACVCVWDRLISYNIISSMFIHTANCVRIFFHFKVNNIPLYTYTTFYLLTHSIYGHFCYFHSSCILK